MDALAFEEMLSELCQRLTSEAQQGATYEGASDFEERVRRELVSMPQLEAESVDFSPHPHQFPDIILGMYGIEVKFTKGDSWRSVANSVFESTRNPSVTSIYVVFGKLGGQPEVKWEKYDECVIHVRTSHVPRFEIEIGSDRSLFATMGISYAEFRALSTEDRMIQIRKYARNRLSPGERLWWLEDRPDSAHSLPIQVRLYMDLAQDKKRQLRAEAALLCPQIVKPPRSKKKYDDAALYLLTYHGVLCSQARDLFSAGSVALKNDSKRGGNYLLRALKDIEGEMRAAAARLEPALFKEYWGFVVAPEQRICKWLELADGYAQDWIPSKELFRA